MNCLNDEVILHLASYMYVNKGDQIDKYHIFKLKKIKTLDDYDKHWLISIILFVCNYTG